MKWFGWALVAVVISALVVGIGAVVVALTRVQWDEGERLLLWWTLGAPLVVALVIGAVAAVFAGCEALARWWREREHEWGR